MKGGQEVRAHTSAKLLAVSAAMDDAGVMWASADEAQKVRGSATWRPLQTKGIVLSGMTDSEVPEATPEPGPANHARCKFISKS